MGICNLLVGLGAACSDQLSVRYGGSDFGVEEVWSPLLIYDSIGWDSILAAEY